MLAIENDRLNHEVRMCNKYPDLYLSLEGAEAKIVFTDPELFRKAASVEKREMMIGDILADSGSSNMFEK